jgi:hypothetical protein
MLDNGGIAPHARPPKIAGLNYAELTLARRDQSAPPSCPQVAPPPLWRSICRTNGTHLPHCGRQPQA